MYLSHTFIACPSVKVEEFTGSALVVNLGVENLGDFNLGSSSTVMGGGGG